MSTHDIPHVDIWTDGSSRGNPGPGGYGAVLLFVDGEGREHRRELSCGFRHTTNNRMEMLAVITAFEALKFPCRVDLFSDSSYVINAHTKGWISTWEALNWKTKGKKAVKNVDLWKRMVKAMQPHTIEFHWVKGHAGTQLNERCDALATSAADLDPSDQEIDEVFEKENPIC